MIERARGIAATHFMRQTKGEVFLSLDSDIIQFSKKDIDQMCEQTREYDIVAAVYICRSTMRTFPATFFEEGKTVEFGSDPTPVPVKWAATGCMAVHRRVFERLAEDMPLLHASDGPRAFYDFFETMHWAEPELGGELIKLSEDYAFSKRAKDAGFGVHINPAVRVGHIGQYVHRLEDMAQEMLAPQALAITRLGRDWRVEHAGIKQTPESMGRIPEGRGEEIRNKFDSRAERRRRQREERKNQAVSVG